LVVSEAGTEAGFACVAGTFLASAVLLYRVRADETVAPVDAEATRVVSHAVAGIRAIASNPSLALLVGLFAAQTLTNGALNVLLVVLAVKLLTAGASGRLSRLGNRRRLHSARSPRSRSWRTGGLRLSSVAASPFGERRSSSRELSAAA
jgi:hypothetical protein